MLIEPALVQPIANRVYGWVATNISPGVGPYVIQGFLKDILH